MNETPLCTKTTNSTSIGHKFIRISFNAHSLDNALLVFNNFINTKYIYVSMTLMTFNHMELYADI